MCGRFALGMPREQLKLDFGLDDCDDFPVRYNISPGTDIPVIRQSPDGRRVGSMDELFDEFLRKTQQYASDFPAPGGTFKSKED